MLNGFLTLLTPLIWVVSGLRMIGIASKVLDALMLGFSNKPLTQKVLVTFMAVCAIVARPLIPVSIDPENPQILSPAMFLTEKTADLVHLDNIDEKILYHIQWKSASSCRHILETQST